MRALALLQRRIRNLYRRKQIARLTQKRLERHDYGWLWHARRSLEADRAHGQRSRNVAESRVYE